jgi:hypothetical protein
MKNFDDYFKKAQRPVRGLTSYEAALGLTHVTKAIYEPIYLDAKEKHRQFNLTRGGKAGGYLSLRQKRAKAAEYLEGVRDYLTGFFGSSWSPQWAQLGFLNGTLKLPGKDASRCTILENVKLYFTEHPDHENAAKEYTAAKAGSVCTPLTDAVANVEDCKFEARTKFDLRDKAIRLLDKKLSELRKELETVLEPTDPRWLKFFDRIPGDPRVPDQVEEVTASVAGNIMIVNWPDAPRADHYKLFKQVVGVDAEPVLVSSVEDSDAQFPVTPGTVVKLQVVPSNAMGDGPASDVLEIAA